MTYTRQTVTRKQVFNMARKKASASRGISPKGPERERTTMRLSIDVMKAMKKIAARQNRSVSNLVETTLQAYAEDVLGVKIARPADEEIFA
jgi:predicted HicB family RNase H-like nuclease